MSQKLRNLSPSISNSTSNNSILRNSRCSHTVHSITAKYKTWSECMTMVNFLNTSRYIYTWWNIMQWLEIKFRAAVFICFFFLPPTLDIVIHMYLCVCVYMCILCYYVKCTCVHLYVCRTKITFQMQYFLIMCNTLRYIWI